MAVYNLFNIAFIPLTSAAYGRNDGMESGPFATYFSTDSLSRIPFSSREVERASRQRRVGVGRFHHAVAVYAEFLSIFKTPSNDRFISHKRYPRQCRNQSVRYPKHWWMYLEKAEVVTQHDSTSFRHFSLVNVWLPIRGCVAVFC